MKKGDLVQRKEKYRNLNNWVYGDRFFVVNDVTFYGDVALEGLPNAEWAKSYFDVIEDFDVVSVTQSSVELRIKELMNIAESINQAKIRVLETKLKNAENTLTQIRACLPPVV